MSAVPLPEPKRISDLAKRVHWLMDHYRLTDGDELYRAMRAYGDAVRADERERMMPLIDEAILDAVGAALAGAGYDGDAIEKIAPRVLEMWRGFKSAVAIRASAMPDSRRHDPTNAGVG